VNIPRILILWDIDRTLLTMDNAGKKAFLEAGQIVFGDGFTMDGVDTLGRLDPAILKEAVEVSGLGDPGGFEMRFRAAYRDRLEGLLLRRPTIRLLPGVRSLVGRLGKIPSVTQGVLSGNYPEIGRLKLRLAGLCRDPFKVWVGGSDGDTRRDLVQVALSRYAGLTGVAVTAWNVVIIGDTPRDVDCAIANGCRCLAVATGRFSKEMLEAAGAHCVRENLTCTEQMLGWICNDQTGDIRL
jgi:phosphoglycolate phosphatase-like HAD superfamily hydrolase